MKRTLLIFFIISTTKCMDLSVDNYETLFPLSIEILENFSEYSEDNFMEFSLAQTGLVPTSDHDSLEMEQLN